MNTFRLVKDSEDKMHRSEETDVTSQERRDRTAEVIARSEKLLERIETETTRQAPEKK